jgi:hypothetical protein
MKAQAKFIKYSVCDCGFPILSDDIQLGTIYVVHSEKRKMCSLLCGGCGKVIKDIPCIYVEPRNASRGGFLPAEIFEIDEGPTVPK